jgi:hypothetical protein
MRLDHDPQRQLLQMPELRQHERLQLDWCPPANQAPPADADALFLRSRNVPNMDGVAPDLGGLELEITIASPDGPDRTEPMFQVWRDRCPIYLALLKPNTIDLRVTRAAA